MIESFLFSDVPPRLFMRRGEAGPRNVLAGFLVIGFPCLWEALFGRFALRVEKEE